MQKAVIIAALAALSVIAVDPPVVEANRVQGDLEVTVTYTGKGTVDATHEIWVFLFDAPAPDNMPVAVQAITKSGAAATFKGLTASPVYVFVVYDENGDYDATAGPPPAGSPAGRYSTDGKEPSPVKPGPDAKVTVSFDDSHRVGQ